MMVSSSHQIGHGLGSEQQFLDLGAAGFQYEIGAGEPPAVNEAGAQL